MSEELNAERKRLLQSFMMPLSVVLLLWAVKLFELALNTSFGQYGLYPKSLNGLTGIITSPFLHADLSHLLANTTSLFVLLFFLYLFYRVIATRVLILIWLITGFWVWVFARESYHIGASGVVYGLAAFLFVSGIIRRNPALSVVSLVIVFLYGSMVWGVFPEFFPKRNISWESHFMGMLSGLILAFFYRNYGPQRRVYSWELEEELEEETMPDNHTNHDENKPGH